MSASTVSRPSGPLDTVGLTPAERVGYWMDVAMGIFCAAILVAAAMTALVS